MSQPLLLPTNTRIVGLFMIIAAISIYLLNDRTFWYLNLPIAAYEEPFGPKQYFTISRVAFYDTFLCVLFLLGLMCIAFSRIRKEDEFINSLRLRAWLWAVLINVGLACIALLFFYGMSFFGVIAGNLFSLLALFIIRFYYLLYKSNKVMPA